MAIAEAPGPDVSESEQAKAKKPKPTKFLPTDRIAFSRQLEILRAFAAVSGPNGKAVTNAEVGEVMKMEASTVSLANPFFAENGLLQRGADGGFVPAADVMAFQGAWDWNPEKAAQRLAPTLAETWFCKALTPRLGFRPLPEDEAIEVLAEACGAVPEYKAQLRTLLDYLQAAAIVQREGGQVRANRVAATLPAGQIDGRGATPESKEPAAPSRAAVTTAFATPTEGVVQFHVAVRVDMKEFAGWSPDRISAFFGGIAQVLAAKGAIEKEVSS
jgi:hypothetical protein